MVFWKNCVSPITCTVASSEQIPIAFNHNPAYNAGMSFAHLNHSIPAENGAFRDAWRRVLNRLGDYTATIAHTLNMRPGHVALLSKTDEHVLVRIQMPDDYVVLRIAPEGDLSREIFFGRSLMRNNLPTARILHQDTSRTLVPFAYTLECFIGGITGDQLEATHECYALARQTGRILRRVHRVPAPGWGYPGPTGRWTIEHWGAVLHMLHKKLAPPHTAHRLFTEEEQTVIINVLHHLAATCDQPCLMHGNVGPHTVRCTVGDHVQFEAFDVPGPVVAGDGLLDLAWGLDPSAPEAWNQGLLEGYTSMTPLTQDDRERLWLCQLVTNYWKACERCFHIEPFEAHVASVRQGIEHLKAI